MMKKYKSIALYLVFLFAIPFACIGLMKVSPLLENGAGNLVLFGIEAASPTLTVLIVWFIQGGSKEVRNGIREKYGKRFSYKYIVVAILIPLSILTLAKGVILFLYPGQCFAYSITMKKVTIIAWALVAEELGWRGFLQEKLDETVPKRVVPLIIGVIWALWHSHFVLSGSMDIPVVPFLLGCIFESYGYYTITKLAKGNVIPACIWHFTGNLMFNVYRFDPSWNQGNTEFYWIASGMYFLNVLLFFYMERKAKE